MTMKVTSKQIRAARVLSGLGVRELAEAAGLSSSTISLIETGHTTSPRAATLDELRAALEERGIEFGPNGWIRHVDDHQGGPGEKPGLPPALYTRVLGLLRQATSVLERHEAATAGASGPVPAAANQDAES